jgi:hypothetical protein
MRRYFTLEEANAILPLVVGRLEQAIHVRAELAMVRTWLEGLARRVSERGGLLMNREEFLGRRARQEALAARLQELISEIESLGCQVKDLDAGLVDFPTFYNGSEVLLCWKLGEPAIDYWHGTQEGFRGRRVIDPEFIRNHRGDPPN